jgi:hypothetical protein
VASPIGFTKAAAVAFTQLPAQGQAHLGEVMRSIAANPYGTGRALDREAPYDRVMGLPDGWIRYAVRPLEQPEVLITDLDWYRV